MKKNPIFLLFFFLFSSCSLGLYQLEFGNESVESRANSVSELPAGEFPVTDDIYSFIIFTDIHVGTDDFNGCFQRFLSWFDNQTQFSDKKYVPMFAISIGDNMDTGREWREYNNLIEEMSSIASNNGILQEFRVYSAVGNHDLYHNGWENFKNHVYPYKSSYRFTDGTFSFYILDSANGTLGNAQRDSLESMMKSDKNPKLVFTHVPLYAGGCPKITFTMQNTMERNVLLTLFQKNDVRWAFEGHAHLSYGCNYGSWREDVLPAFRKGNCVLVTVDKISKKISSRIVEF